MFVKGKEIYKVNADNKNIDFPTQFCIGDISNKFEVVCSREVSRPTLIDLDPVELNYYPFMINIDKKCNGSCNAADDLSTKICVPSKTKDVNVNVFNMVTKINEAKTLVKHISCDCE